MPDARALIRSAVAACGVHPPHRFVWFGRRIRVILHGRPDGVSARKGFLLALAKHLYAHLYCRGEAVPVCPPRRISGVGEVRAFMTSLSAANRHADRWDTGWTLVERRGDQWVVRKWDLDFTVTAEQCRPHPSDSLRGGPPADVLVPSERWFEYPGYMLFYGQRVPRPPVGTAGLTRLYLDLDGDGIRRMIDYCGTLDDLEIPFTLKVAGHPEVLDRCDTVILFIERQDYARASETLVEAAERFRPKLRARSPVFAKPLVPGVGVADDPLGEGSFGESRCRLLAEAIVLASEIGESSVEARLRIIEDRFHQAGIHLDRPHLNPASAEYEIGPWNRWPSSPAGLP